MSWFFVVSGEEEGSKDRTHPFSTSPLFSLSLPGLFISFGGIEETCLFEYSEVEAKGWGVVGVGIHERGGDRQIMSKEEWRTQLSEPTFDPSKLDGHFVAIRWKDGLLEFFVDQLGLRTFYYAKSKGNLCISSRLDWISTYTKLSDIDLRMLGSRWLAYNQFTRSSPIRGIERVSQSGYLCVEGGRVIRSHHLPFYQTFRSESIANGLNVIESIVRGVKKFNATPSLALSGGLDSRMLLALMLRSTEKGWRVHTLGDPTHPDVQVGRAIAEKLNLEYHHIHPTLFDPDVMFERMTSYALQAQLIEFASTATKLQYGEELRSTGHFAIDGGFGEIGRRSLFKRLAKLGKRAIDAENIPKLVGLLRYDRPQIFRPEILTEMERGVEEELRSVIEEMPAIHEVGYENYVDIFALRTRIPNYGGYEQARVDAEVVNLMPFMQPSYVRAMLNAPLSEKLGGRFYKNFIRENAPSLTNFPLVKGSASYRFSLSARSAWVAGKIQQKMGGGWVNKAPDILFHHIKAHVLDLLRSSEVQSNPLYDLNTITRAVEGYYQGNGEYRPLLDGWLTFELWRGGFGR